MYWRIATLSARRTSSSCSRPGCKRPLRSPTNELASGGPSDIAARGSSAHNVVRADVRMRPVGLSTCQEMTGARIRIQSWQSIRARHDHADHFRIIGPHRERVREILQHDPVRCAVEVDITDCAPDRPAPIELHGDAVRQAGRDVGRRANDRVRVVTQVVHDDVVDEVVRGVALERVACRGQTVPERSRRIVEHVETIGFGDRVVPADRGQSHHRERR